MIPYIHKIEGVKNKPVFLIIAGVHGDELTPIYTLCNLIIKKQLDGLKKHFSEIIIINGINISALRAGTREPAKIDEKKDLNRQFTVYDFTFDDSIKMIKKYVEDSDVIIDIHASPNIPEFALIDMDDNTNSFVEWCKKSDVQYACRYSSSNTIKKYANLLGKKALTLELNGMGKPDAKSGELGAQMVYRLIENYEKVNFNQTPPTIPPIIEINTYVEGLFSFTQTLGTFVHKNDIIGHIYGLSGNITEVIKSRVDGIIVEGPDYSYYVKAGAKVAYIQPI